MFSKSEVTEIIVWPMILRNVATKNGQLAIF